MSRHDDSWKRCSNSSIGQLVNKSGSASRGDQSGSRADFFAPVAFEGE